MVGHAFDRDHRELVGCQGFREVGTVDLDLDGLVEPGMIATGTIDELDQRSRPSPPETLRCFLQSLVGETFDQEGGVVVQVSNQDVRLDLLSDRSRSEDTEDAV